MRPRKVSKRLQEIIPLESLESPGRARDWAQMRFDRALLILADLTAPLRPFARHWILRDTREQFFLGMAVRFEGFDRPVVSIVAENEGAFETLFVESQRASRCAGKHPCLLRKYRHVDGRTVRTSSRPPRS